MPDISSLPKKVFLTGADYFHLVLDKHAQKNGAGGNVMRKVFHFDTQLDPVRIKNILDSSPVIYWLCNIKLISGSIFTRPYWEFVDTGNSIELREYKEETENEIPQQILDRDITVRSKRFIEADIIHYRSGSSAFVVSWNHMLLDAKGTKQLFEHLDQRAFNNKNGADYFPSKEKKVSIAEYVRNMYVVKKFIETSSKAPVSSVATKNTAADAKTSYSNVQFTTAQTTSIQQNAFRSGSRFGPTLFYIACCAHIMHDLNKQRNNAGDLWIPVPYDGRAKGAAGPLISNHVSFIFYRIPPARLTSVEQTVRFLQDQMTDQIRIKMPQRYTMFLNMMRRVPLWLYYFLISKTGEGTFASFLYTSTGDHFNQLTSLFGKQIRNINMIPALTLPPGLTFVFLKHNEQLNVNIAYSPAVISNNELHLIESKLSALLLS